MYLVEVSEVAHPRVAIQVHLPLRLLGLPTQHNTNTNTPLVRTCSVSTTVTPHQHPLRIHVCCPVLYMMLCDGLVPFVVELWLVLFGQQHLQRLATSHQRSTATTPREDNTKGSAQAYPPLHAWTRDRDPSQRGRAIITETPLCPLSLTTATSLASFTQ